MPRKNKSSVLLGTACFLLLQAGCVCTLPSLLPSDIARFEDAPIPGETAVWLEGWDQSVITPHIAQEARGISGITRRERLYKAMEHIWQTFSYDIWLNTEAFRRTADELFRSRVLGGCSDFALVELCLFRAVGIPSRMVITANVDWIYEHQKDSSALSEGHSFIEVYLEDRWHLVDSTYRCLFSEYAPGSKSYPHGEYFCRRGKDFWHMGLRSNDDLDAALKKAASEFQEDFREPSYPKDPL
jgi:hypothetical protein